MLGTPPRRRQAPPVIGARRRALYRVPRDRGIGGLATVLGPISTIPTTYGVSGGGSSISVGGGRVGWWVGPGGATVDVDRPGAECEQDDRSEYSGQ